MSKNDFFKHPEVSQLSGGLRGCGIVLYVFGGQNFLSVFRYFEAGLVAMMVGLIAGILLIVFGLLIHLCQSRAASVALTVFGVIYMILAILLTGHFTGWLYALVGAMSIMLTFKFQKAWTEYQETGIISIDV